MACKDCERVGARLDSSPRLFLTEVAQSPAGSMVEGMSEACEIRAHGRDESGNILK